MRGEAQRLAQRSYDGGAATYFFVLQTTGPYLDARNRESLLAGDMRRATAELERGVGIRLMPAVPNLPGVEPQVELRDDPERMLESQSPQVDER